MRTVSETLYRLLAGPRPARRVITVGVIERGAGGASVTAWVVRQDGQDVARFERLEDAKACQHQLEGRGPGRAA